MMTGNDLRASANRGATGGIARPPHRPGILGLAALLIAAGAIGLLSPAVRAHGGQFSAPGGQPAVPKGRPGGPATPRSGGVTASEEPRWRNWWDRNREDFFDVRERRIEIAGGAGQEGYDAALHQPATREDVEKLIVPVLLDALKSGSADMRDAAAIALGRVGTGEHAEALLPLLSDAKREVREAAMLGLGLLLSERAETILAEILESPDTSYQDRGVAALALGLSGGPTAEKALLRDLGTAKPFGPASRVRWQQADGHRALALGLLGKRELAPILMEAFEKDDSKDASFRPMALTGLARLADPRAAELALEALEDRKNDVRRAAAILAGRSLSAAEEKQVIALIRALRDEKDAHARNFLLTSLGRVSGPLAVKELETVLVRGKRKEERGHAALGLGITGDSEGREVLVKVLTKERDSSLRGAAAIGLGIQGARESAPVILELLQKTGDPELRADLVTALAMLGHREALPTIREVAGEARNARLVRDCGFAFAVLEDEGAIELMLSILRNSSSIEVKGGIASALGRTGDRRVLEKVSAIAQDEKESDLTRAFAVVALGLVGDKSPRSAFTRVSIDSNFALINAEALKQVIDIF